MYSKSTSLGPREDKSGYFLKNQWKAAALLPWNVNGHRGGRDEVFRGCGGESERVRSNKQVNNVYPWKDDP